MKGWMNAENTMVTCCSSALKTVDITGFFKKRCITTRTISCSERRYCNGKLGSSNDFRVFSYPEL